MKTVTTAVFVRALSQVEPRASWLKLLRAHQAFPGCAATATKLGKKVGYKDYRGVNGAYGSLAGALAPLVDVPESRIGLIADFIKPGSATNKEWILVLRPPFVEALQRAGWL